MALPEREPWMDDADYERYCHRAGEQPVAAPRAEVSEAIIVWPQQPSATWTCATGHIDQDGEWQP